MILFDDVIKVLTAPHNHVFPLWILASQKPQCLMAAGDAEGLSGGPEHDEMRGRDLDMRGLMRAC
jgi:hypothetical protein